MSDLTWADVRDGDLVTYRYNTWHPGESATRVARVGTPRGSLKIGAWFVILDGQPTRGSVNMELLVIQRPERPLPTKPGTLLAVTVKATGERFTVFAVRPEYGDTRYVNSADRFTSAPMFDLTDWEVLYDPED